MKTMLQPYKSKITSITEFPFKEFFSQVIVKDRDHLLFLIGNRTDLMKVEHSQPTIPNGQVDYLIRKTKHTAKSGILFF
jgi:hypothetical protein